MYNIHGGQANAVTEIENKQNPDGSWVPVESTHIKYENEEDFRLFGGDSPYQYMRVQVVATENPSPTATSAIDNMNVEPQGTGTPIEVMANPGYIQTTSYNEYLMYILNPRIYTSAKDVVAEVPCAHLLVDTHPSLEPVYVYAGPAQWLYVARDPERGGDAVPVQLGVVVASYDISSPTLVRGGDAVPVILDLVFSSKYVVTGSDELEVNVDESRPGPVKVLTKPLQIQTRPVLIGVTQN